MLSLFSVPKAFVGQVGAIQHNAIGSWKRLAPECEIVLFGDDPGVAEAAARHGVRHEPAVVRNDFGTPILTDIFARMDGLARHPTLAFVNADVILLGDFLSSVRAVARHRRKFLLVSSRFNCEIDRPLPFEPGWEAALRARARGENRMYPAAGSDLFVYPRGLFHAVPSFAIGRGYWDNWLMREARGRGASLVDATAVLTAVHQDHAYDHVARLPAAARDSHVYGTAEGRRNLKLAGGQRGLYTLFDSTEILTADGRLLSTWRPDLIHRRLKTSLRRAARALAFAAAAAPR